MGFKLTTSVFMCMFKLVINGSNISAIVLAGNLLGTTVINALNVLANLLRKLLVFFILNLVFKKFEMNL